MMYVALYQNVIFRFQYPFWDISWCICAPYVAPGF